MSLNFKEIHEINFEKYFLNKEYNYLTVKDNHEIISIKKLKERKFYNLYEIK